MNPFNQQRTLFTSLKEEWKVVSKEFNIHISYDNQLSEIYNTEGEKYKIVKCKGNALNWSIYII